jgi:hypothetical protein
MLWQKLKQLESHCDVKIESALAKSGALSWRVSIAPRDAAAKPIIVERPDITDAVADGLAQAERSGWLP